MKNIFSSVSEALVSKKGFVFQRALANGPNGRESGERFVRPVRLETQEEATEKLKEVKDKIKSLNGFLNFNKEGTEQFKTMIKEATIKTMAAEKLMEQKIGVDWDHGESEVKFSWKAPRTPIVRYKQGTTFEQDGDKIEVDQEWNYKDAELFTKSELKEIGVSLEEAAGILNANSYEIQNLSKDVDLLMEEKDKIELYQGEVTKYKKHLSLKKSEQFKEKSLEKRLISLALKENK